MEDEDFAVMRTISKQIGLTSFQLGKVLKKDGLRDGDGSPSMTAMAEGWVSQYRLRCGRIAYKWHKTKVLEWWKKRPQATETKQDTRKRTK